MSMYVCHRSPPPHSPHLTRPHLARPHLARPHLAHPHLDRPSITLTSLALTSIPLTSFFFNPIDISSFAPLTSPTSPCPLPSPHPRPYLIISLMHPHASIPSLPRSIRTPSLTIIHALDLTPSCTRRKDLVLTSSSSCVQPHALAPTPSLSHSSVPPTCPHPHVSISSHFHVYNHDMYLFNDNT